MKRGAAQGRGRVLWLSGALVATLLAAQWVSGEDGGTDPNQAGGEETPAAETRASKTRAPSEAPSEVMEAEGLELERLERRKFSSQAGDIFRQQSWAPPPPPPDPDNPPPPPPPPPLQFKYLGKIIEGDEIRVFLALAERNYILKPGENINSQYRMDAVTDNSITFTYLPLNAKQALSTAGGTVADSF
jgi:hypothetical protein